MTFDPRDLLPADLQQAEEARHDALDFFERNPEFVVPDEEAARIVREEHAIRLVIRYHGEGRDLAQRVQPYAARGRGVCSRCSHPVYFDDRAKMAPYMPMTFMCMPCMVEETIAQHPALAPPSAELAELLACPHDCTWTSP